MTKGKRILSALGIVILTTSTLVAEPVWAATSSELQDQQNAIKKQQEQTQDEYDDANDKADEIAAEQSEVGSQIDSTNSELVSLLANVELIKTQIETKETEIVQTQAEYDEAKAQEETLYAAMCERIKYMYEKGDSSYVEILMSATSYADLTTKAEYVEQLYDYDREQLAAYVAVQQEKATYKAQLEDEKGELETTQDELAEEQGSLETLLSQYQETYDDYDAQLAQAQTQADAYAAKLKAQTDQIASLDSEIANAKAAEEAERKAQEEAAAKAAAEAAAAKKQNSSNGNNNSSNSSGTSSGSSKTYTPAGDATGSNVAAYACQFVGNPYVFGGTSLTDGCDCSGFVYSVYKSFGITVPRNSYSLASAGTEVSYEDAQPGDVIVYPGHCAIYLGDGRIVHASSAKTGIKYGYALYRTITTVRRFL